MILYNPKNGSPIRDIFAQAVYKMPVNTMHEFDDEVGKYLLEKFGFLVEVTPDNVIKLKKEMDRPEPQTEEEKKKLAFEHLSDKQREALQSIPKATPVGHVKGPTVKPRQLTPDEQEGIPMEGKDRDGVDWYGPGVENDTVSPPSAMRLKVPGSGGVFGAS